PHPPGLRRLAGRPGLGTAPAGPGPRSRCRVRAGAGAGPAPRAAPRAAGVARAGDGREGGLTVRSDRSAERRAANGLLDLAAPQAAGADRDLLRTSVHLGAHALDVRLEHALGDVVRVADVLAGHALLAADEALRHGISWDG